MPEKELLQLALRVSKTKNLEHLKQVFSKRLEETWEGKRILNCRDISMEMIARMRELLR